MIFLWYINLSGDGDGNHRPRFATTSGDVKLVEATDGTTDGTTERCPLHDTTELEADCKCGIDGSGVEQDCKKKSFCWADGTCHDIAGIPCVLKTHCTEAGTESVSGYYNGTGCDCACSKGWSGNKCDTRSDLCQDDNDKKDMCGGHGNVTGAVGKCSCECHIGWEGEFCTTPKDNGGGDEDSACATTCPSGYILHKCSGCGACYQPCTGDEVFVCGGDNIAYCTDPNAQGECPSNRFGYLDSENKDSVCCAEGKLYKSYAEEDSMGGASIFKAAGCCDSESDDVCETHIGTDRCYDQTTHDCCRIEANGDAMKNAGICPKSATAGETQCCGVSCCEANNCVTNPNDSTKYCCDQPCSGVTSSSGKVGCCDYGQVCVTGVNGEANRCENSCPYKPYAYGENASGNKETVSCTDDDDDAACTVKITQMNKLLGVDEASDDVITYAGSGSDRKATCAPPFQCSSYAMGGNNYSTCFNADSMCQFDFTTTDFEPNIVLAENEKGHDVQNAFVCKNDTYPDKLFWKAKDNDYTPYYMSWSMGFTQTEDADGNRMCGPDVCTHKMYTQQQASVTLTSGEKMDLSGEIDESNPLHTGTPIVPDGESTCVSNIDCGKMSTFGKPFDQIQPGDKNVVHNYNVACRQTDPDNMDPSDPTLTKEIDFTNINPHATTHNAGVSKQCIRCSTNLVGNCKFLQTGEYCEHSSFDGVHCNAPQVRQGVSGTTHVWPDGLHKLCNEKGVPDSLKDPDQFTCHYKVDANNQLVDTVIKYKDGVCMNPYGDNVNTNSANYKRLMRIKNTSYTQTTSSSGDGESNDVPRYTYECPCSEITSNNSSHYWAWNEDTGQCNTWTKKSGTEKNLPDNKHIYFIKVKGPKLASDGKLADDNADYTDSDGNDLPMIKYTYMKPGSAASSKSKPFYLVADHHDDIYLSEGTMDTPPSKRVDPKGTNRNITAAWTVNGSGSTQSIQAINHNAVSYWNGGNNQWYLCSHGQTGFAAVERNPLGTRTAHTDYEVDGIVSIKAKRSIDDVWTDHWLRNTDDGQSGDWRLTWTSIKKDRAFFIAKIT